MSRKKPRITITMGDVNGVGPEILVKALARPTIWKVCRPLIVGSPEAYQAAHHIAPAAPLPQAFNRTSEVAYAEGEVPVLTGGIASPTVRPGVLDPNAGRSAVEWIKYAVRMAKSKVTDAIVTCPINKEGIHRAGFDYAGHTELIARMTRTKDYRMSLFTNALRIVHITSHLSMREAVAAVKADRIATSIRLGDEALRLLDLPRRKIAVAGLNPHAGEAGAFGTEEVEQIKPAVATCQCEGIDCSGPYPPDTVFWRAQAGEFDMVIAMYHDQGHIPLKLIAMDEGVNVTLGLPIIRTSVDHGTAYDIAGRGVANEASLCAALELAARLARHRAEEA